MSPDPHDIERKVSYVDSAKARAVVRTTGLFDGREPSRGRHIFKTQLTI